MEEEQLSNKKIKEIINDIIEKRSRIPYFENNKDDYLYLIKDSDTDKSIKKQSA